MPLDVDHFKRVNDEFGQEAGDQALCTLVDILRHRLRRLYYVFRYGGEEFIALLAETDEPRAVPVAEELRSHIQQTEILPGQHVTVSFGVCDVTRAESVDDWLNQSDRALYRAKA